MTIYLYKTMYPFPSCFGVGVDVWWVDKISHNCLCFVCMHDLLPSLQTEVQGPWATVRNEISGTHSCCVAMQIIKFLITTTEYSSLACFETYLAETRSSSEESFFFSCPHSSHSSCVTDKPQSFHPRTLAEKLYSLMRACFILFINNIYAFCIA